MDGNTGSLEASWKSQRVRNLPEYVVRVLYIQRGETTKMTAKQIEDAEDHYNDFPSYPLQPCFGVEYEAGTLFCENCRDKRECWVKQETGCIPTAIISNEPDGLDAAKAQTIQELMNYGHVNKHEVKAGSDWYYHFSDDCIVLLVFKCR